MKNFQNKKFQKFFVLILEVSEHILNQKNFRKKNFQKNFNSDFGRYLRFPMILLIYFQFFEKITNRKCQAGIFLH